MSAPHPDKTPEKAGTEDRRDWASIPVVPVLPESLHAAEGSDEIFVRLAGAKIIRIGAPSIPVADRLEGGGLVIDYTLPGSAVEHRLVFAFNELGMWIERDSYRNDGNPVFFDRALTPEEITDLVTDQK